MVMLRRAECAINFPFVASSNPCWDSWSQFVGVYVCGGIVPYSQSPKPGMRVNCATSTKDELVPRAVFPPHLPGARPVYTHTGQHSSHTQTWASSPPKFSPSKLYNNFVQP